MGQQRIGKISLSTWLAPDDRRAVLHRWVCVCRGMCRCSPERHKLDEIHIVQEDHGGEIETAVRNRAGGSGCGGALDKAERERLWEMNFSKATVPFVKGDKIPIWGGRTYKSTPITLGGKGIVFRDEREKELLKRTFELSESLFEQLESGTCWVVYERGEDGKYRGLTRKAFDDLVAAASNTS